MNGESLLNFMLTIGQRPWQQWGKRNVWKLNGSKNWYIGIFGFYLFFFFLFAQLNTYWFISLSQLLRTLLLHEIGETTHSIYSPDFQSVSAFSPVDFNSWLIVTCCVKRGFRSGTRYKRLQGWLMSEGVARGGGGWKQSLGHSYSFSVIYWAEIHTAKINFISFSASTWEKKVYKWAMSMKKRSIGTTIGATSFKGLRMNGEALMNRWKGKFVDSDFVFILTRATNLRLRHSTFF